MDNYIIKNFMKSLTIFSFIIIFLANPAFSEEDNSITELIDKAEQYLMIGQYTKSITVYDQILEITPMDSNTHEMKGIALSNISLQSTLASQETTNAPIKYEILESIMRQKSILHVQSKLSLTILYLKIILIILKRL